MSVPVAVVEGGGRRASWLVLCDHASNRVPEDYDLGISAETLESHAAWDPGALEVARLVAGRLDAPLVYCSVSRLVCDVNRVEDAPDIFPARSEVHDIPGNRDLSDEDRMHRVLTVHAPYHTAIATQLDEMPENTALVAIHTFNPVYNGVERPWQVAVFHDENARLANQVIGRLEARGDLTVGVNEPYSPADGVYYTLDRHGTAHARPAVMIEVRNDLVRDAEAQAHWAAILAETLEDTA